MLTYSGYPQALKFPEVLEFREKRCGKFLKIFKIKQDNPFKLAKLFLASYCISHNTVEHFCNINMLFGVTGVFYFDMPTLCFFETLL
jgi:hypothetical protein